MFGEDPYIMKCENRRVVNFVMQCRKYSILVESCGLYTRKLSLSVLIEKYYHCVKSVRIRSFSGPYFPAFGLNSD